MLLPQRLGGGGKLLERRLRSKLPLESLLTLTSTSDPLIQSPITVTIHFTAKANQAKALVTQLTGALPNARNAPGCRYANVYEILGNSNQVILFKGWDSQNAQASYLQSEQSSGRLVQLLALVEGEPMVEYWEFQAT